MQKTFNPENIEQKWYQFWEQSGYFKPQGKGDPYCIVVPPPNITGHLHMGHGFQLSLMDALIRYHRMSGYNTHWQIGTDHAGIATQLLVENQFAKEGIERKNLTRETFEERAFKWTSIAKDIIYNQQRRLGVSADWEKEKFTLDAELCNAVRKVFISLYEEDLIYQGNFIVNWDPILKTAISDLEVNFEEQDGALWYISYPIAGDAENKLVVATTRPETLFGDVAVAINPEDERYKHLIGKKVQIPLAERLVPIISDESVDKDFGTGCLKITPAHDFNDYAIGKRHKLPLINIFTQDAKLNDEVPVMYRGLDRFVARNKVIEDLKKEGLLVKVVDHKNKVPKGDRSGAILEPYLTKQWFVRAKPLANKAISALKENEFRFVPENWDKIYLHWLENIEDWCISRQLWWGHRIPAWYNSSGNVYVGNNEKEIREKYQIPQNEILIQDEDVLDTWFSSALWPFSSLGWPQETDDFKTFYPTNALITGFDIIFFWVARMVMMGIKFTGKAPFKDVYITGLIRDKKGQKMSKSKGNTLDPIDLIDGITLENLIEKRTSNLLSQSLVKSIEKATKEEFPSGIHNFGTDALRFTFCALASTSRDINFDINRLDGYRNFCNKLWNAARYVVMSVENNKLDNYETISTKYSISDLWIRGRMQEMLREIHQSFKTYRFDFIAQAIYDFTWHEYCDFYLEFCKPILAETNSDLSQKKGAIQTLIFVLEKLLRVIHPLMPFLSEEIWQKIWPLADSLCQIQIAPGNDCKQKDTTEETGCEAIRTIMIQEYPKFDSREINNEAIAQIEWAKKVIINIRNIRSETNIAPNKLINLVLRKGDEKDRIYVAETEIYLKSLAKIDKITWISDTETLNDKAALATIENLEILIPLSGLIDLNAEKVRLLKEISKIEKEIAGLEQKLNNEDFVKKAPANIVTEGKTRLESLCIKLNKLCALKTQFE